MTGSTSSASSDMASVKEERARLMWKPRPDRSTNIHDFQSVVNEAFGLNLSELIPFIFIFFVGNFIGDCYHYGSTYSIKCDFISTRVG